MIILHINVVLTEIKLFKSKFKKKLKKGFEVESYKAKK